MNLFFKEWIFDCNRFLKSICKSLFGYKVTSKKTFWMLKNDVCAHEKNLYTSAWVQNWNVFKHILLAIIQHLKKMEKN